MSKPVFTLRVDKQVIIAKKIMDWGKIRHVPVVDRDERLVGMVTQRDLLRFSISAIDEGTTEVERKQDLWTIPIQRVMRRDVRTIGPDDTVQEAARLMRHHKIGCLPVVDGDVLVGIVSEHDLLGIVERVGHP
ncbi:MAG: CBS domain-containing protein [Longimicrobiales bacterium]